MFLCKSSEIYSYSYVLLIYFAFIWVSISHIDYHILKYTQNFLFTRITINSLEHFFICFLDKLVWQVFHLQAFDPLGLLHAGHSNPIKFWMIISPLALFHLNPWEHAIIDAITSLSLNLFLALVLVNSPQECSTALAKEREICK